MQYWGNMQKQLSIPWNSKQKKHVHVHTDYYAITTIAVIALQTVSSRAADSNMNIEHAADITHMQQ